MSSVATRALTDEELDNILDRVRHDPSFCELLETDPMSALEVAGWSLSPWQVQEIQEAGSILPVVGESGYRTILEAVQQQAV